MEGFEQVAVVLVVIVRLALIGLVVWVAAREIKRAGSKRKPKD